MKRTPQHDFVYNAVKELKEMNEHPINQDVFVKNSIINTLKEISTEQWFKSILDDCEKELSFKIEGLIFHVNEKRL